MKSNRISFNSISESDFDKQFAVIKHGICQYVDAIWGWDDDEQRQRIRENNPQSGFYWVNHNAERVGLICYHPYETRLHVHMLVLFEQHQGKGVGKQVMRKLDSIALDLGCGCITLSSFIENRRAVHFYHSLDYRTTVTEPHFISLQKSL